MWKPVFYYFEMLPPISKVIVFLYYFLQYDEVILSGLLDGCYHYIIFMDLVKGQNQDQNYLQGQVSLKSKSDLAITLL